jgi:MYXO-CTERM domain-containing protein
MPSSANPSDPCGGIENWLAIQAPTETNDRSIDSNEAVADDIVLGKGGLSTISAIPVPMQSPSLYLLVARIGVVRGDMVGCLDLSAWYDGIADRSDDNFFWLSYPGPEPTTLTFLGLGAITLLRRRRGR